MKKIIFEEVEKLFENLENGNKFLGFLINEQHFCFQFSLLDSTRASIVCDRQTMSVIKNTLLQKECEILKELDYVK